MPRRSRRQPTPEEKYRDSKRNTDEILQQYSLEYIKSQRAEYNRLRMQGVTDDALKIFNKFVPEI